MADLEIQRKEMLKREVNRKKKKSLGGGIVATNNTRNNRRRSSTARPGNMIETNGSPSTKDIVNCSGPRKDLTTIVDSSFTTVDEIQLTNEVRSGNPNTHRMYATQHPTTAITTTTPITTDTSSHLATRIPSDGSSRSSAAPVDLLQTPQKPKTVQQAKLQENMGRHGMSDVFEPATPPRFLESQGTGSSTYLDVSPDKATISSNAPPEQIQRRPSESLESGALVGPLRRMTIDGVRSPEVVLEHVPEGVTEQLATDDGRLEFLTNPAPEGQIIHCRITRSKVASKRKPLYSLHMESEEDGRQVTTFLLCAKKRTGKQTSNYVLSHLEGNLDREGDGFIAKLRANFMGTEFTCYDTGVNPEKVVKSKNNGKPLRKELVAMTYEKNYLGMNGPRQMTVLIPALNENKIPYVVQPQIKRDAILARYQMARTTDLIELQNKKPQWNEGTQSYVLNFKGRVTKPSVKNFQLVHKDDLDYVILQFGRVATDVFTMDFQFPMSAIQAFAICLSSFDNKLACE